MAEAFETLMRVHPAHAGHLERGADGRHQIMVDDYEHEGIWLEKIGDACAGRLPSQSQALLNLRLQTGCRSSSEAHPVHPPCAGRRPPPVRPAGEAVRLVHRHRRPAPGSGRSRPSPFRSRWRRCLPSAASSSFSASASSVSCRRCSPTSCRRPSATRDASGPSRFACRRRPAGSPVRRPRIWPTSVRHRRVSLNAVVAAAILMAEWTIRETPHLPIPYIYPVDLRFFLTPPVGATEATNPVGMAMYLAEIHSDTDLLDLARDIVEAFRADLAEGVIQQSFLHFGAGIPGKPARAARRRDDHRRRGTAATCARRPIWWSSSTTWKCCSRRRRRVSTCIRSERTTAVWWSATTATGPSRTATSQRSTDSWPVSRRSTAGRRSSERPRLNPRRKRLCRHSGFQRATPAKPALRPSAIARQFGNHGRTRDQPDVQCPVDRPQRDVESRTVQDRPERVHRRTRRPGSNRPAPGRERWTG